MKLKYENEFGKINVVYTWDIFYLKSDECEIPNFNPIIVARTSTIHKYFGHEFGHFTRDDSNCIFTRPIE